LPKSDSIALYISIDEHGHRSLPASVLIATF
jgi:hypothetical protein